VLGMGPDDVLAVSKHDTSTQANDFNENRLHVWLQEKLGRTPSLPLLVVSQKALTGHPKGAAGAWQMSGLLQAMAEDVVPGNRSLEDVDAAMAPFSTLTFTDTAIPLSRGALRVGLVTSLGFGHVGAIIALAHPFLFWRMLDAERRAQYAGRLQVRLETANATLQRVLSGTERLVTVRTHRPFRGKDGTSDQLAHEAEMLTDPTARLHRQSGVFVSGRCAASALAAE
jgi:fatty acid synthase, bacteria type